MSQPVTYFELTSKNLFRLTFALIVAISLSLFIHQSGTVLFSFLKLSINLVVLPFFLSLVLTYILEPIVSWAEVSGIDKTRSILMIFLILLCVVTGLSILIYPFLIEQISSLRAEVPRYVKVLFEQVVLVENYCNSEIGLYKKIKITATLTHWVERHQGDVVDWVFRFFRTTFSLFLLVPLFTFFLLHDGSAMKRGILSLTPNRYFESLLIILHHVNRSLGRFIRGQFVEAAIIGIIATVGLKIVGVKYFWLLGMLAGVCNLFPIFGPLVSMMLTFGFALLDSGNLFFGVVAVTPLLFGQVIDHIILMPLLITKTASIHFMTGIMAILVGGVMAGALGMVVAVPTVSILKLSFREIFRHWKTRIREI